MQSARSAGSYIYLALSDKRHGTLVITGGEVRVNVESPS